MTQASFCSFTLCSCENVQKMFNILSSTQETVPRMNHTSRPFSLRLSADVKGLTLSLCTRLLALCEIHSMAV